MSPLLTFKQASKLVRRSVRTLDRWVDDGMAVAWFSGVRYVRHDVLMAELKARNLANPTKLSTEQWEKKQARERAKAARELKRRDTQIRM